MSTTMPGYPIPRNRSSSHWMNASNIEAVFSEQGDESRRTEGREAHVVATVSHPLDEREGLRALLAQGNQQAAVRCELLQERRWDLRAARGHQNRSVGRVRAPPQRPVAQEHRDVRDPGLAQRLPGGEGERLHPLDREDGARERPEQGRLIPGAGPDLEHPLPALEAEGFEIAGLGERLRDGLAVADRQRRVFVGTVPHRLGHEQMARSEEHTSELQSHSDLVCRLLLEKKKKKKESKIKTDREIITTTIRQQP